MNDRQVSSLGIIVSISIVGLAFGLAQPGNIAPSMLLSQSGSAINALPPSAAGQPSSPDYLGGVKATGRVAEVYVKVGENVYLSIDRAPEHLKQGAERWVDVQFPDLLANDTDSARAVLNSAEAGVRVGDVVEIKFAHKDNPRFFPVKELTRVTELVARKDEMLAKDYARRILARNGQAPAQAKWLAHASPAPVGAKAEPVTTTADASR